MNLLDLCDDYEIEAYGDIQGFQICSHFDCRDPRRGPFVTANDETFCIRCFRIYIVGEDPENVID